MTRRLERSVARCVCGQLPPPTPSRRTALRDYTAVVNAALASAAWAHDHSACSTQQAA